MSNEPATRIKQLVDELRAVIQASPDRFGAEMYAKLLLDGQTAIPPLTAEQVQAAYAHKFPADDPAFWADFDPKDYVYSAADVLRVLRNGGELGAAGEARP